MLNPEIAVTCVGKIARQKLVQANEATLKGITSRGLFLHLPSGWIIFLSFEGYKGPLTLNLSGNPGMFAHLEIASPVRIFHDCIHFPSNGFSLLLTQAETWQAPEPPAAMLFSDLRKIRLLALARQATGRRKVSQFISWLPSLLEGSAQIEPPFPDVYLRLARLRGACEKARVPEISESLGALLGLGEGLTPSGDDLVIGFLLAASRWGERLFPDLEYKVINQDILARASRATSALSTDLIECASLGQADERLILALDGILTGRPDVAACAAALASWGNTSGFDALVGMGLCVMCNAGEPPDRFQ
jgi:hypothetical protein